MLATVALPVYNNRDICWLALEGLCRQKDPGDWELIICEENNGGHCGVEFFDGYKERLFDAGCTRVIYIPVKSGRFYLSEKWLYMAKLAKGEVFLLQGSDDYPDARRVQLAKQAVAEGYDWFSYNRFYCYLKGHGVYEYHDWDNHLHTGIDKGTRTEYLLKTKPRQLRSGVDSWLLHSVHRIVKDIRVKQITVDYTGVSTTGFNTITRQREFPIYAKMYPYGSTEKKLQDILPPEVAEKLEKL